MLKSYKAIPMPFLLILFHQTAKQLILNHSSKLLYSLYENWKDILCFLLHQKFKILNP